jgi:simple sugar transport system permease protein
MSMRLEPREQTSVLLGLTAPVLAVVASLALCSALIAFAGAPVLPAFALTFEGAFGSTSAIAATLTKATPLIFTGLSVAVAFRSNLWNIGAEGQLYVGALAAVLLGGGIVSLPSWLMIPALFAAGFAAGALLLLFPATLKIRFGVDEVVTTLLLNFVVLLFVSMMLDGPLKDPAAAGWPQSVSIIDSATLPLLIANSQLHLGFALALAAAGVVWILNSRTVWGYEMRAVGANPRAARFAGVPVARVLFRVALLSGGFAGLAGVSEIAGPAGYLTIGLSPGFGYTGIIIATLGRLHPIGVVLAAVFMAGIFIGADAMSRSLAVPNYIADVIVSVSLVTMLIAALFATYRVRRG